MGKLFFSYVGFFVRSRSAAKKLVAVGMPSKSGNNLPYIISLLHQRLVYRQEVYGHLYCDVFTKLDEKIKTVEVIGPLAMTQRQAINNLEPRRRQRRIVTIRQAFHDQRQCGGILSQGTGVVSPHRP